MFGPRRRAREYPKRKEPTLTPRHSSPGPLHLSGLGLCIALAALAYLVGTANPVVWGLCLGAALANTPLPLGWAHRGAAIARTRVLDLAIIGLGAGLDPGALGSVGWQGLGLVVLVTAATVALSLPIGRALGIDRAPSLLVGVGTAVCGSSAIAAAAPALGAREADVGLSMAVVNLLGTVGMFALPVFAVSVGLGTEQAALWIGGSLQAVGHVAGAGFAVSEDVGALAVAVKMGRVALLVPLVLVLSAGQGQRGRIRVPWYLVAFALVALLAGSGMLRPVALSTVQQLAKALLTVAMVGIGLKLRLPELLRQGPRVVGLGIAIWAVQLALLGLGIWGLGIWGLGTSS